MQPKVAGIVRFSVITRTGLKAWRATRGRSAEAAISVLFNPARLALRLRLFRATTLACFRHEWNNGAKFRLVILVSPLLPPAWREELERMVADAPFIDLVSVPFESTINAAVKSYVAERLPSAATVLTFRIDDDDCVQTGWIDRASVHAVPEQEGKVVGFVNGVYCTLLDGEICASEKHYKNNAFGISYVSNSANFESIFDLGSHTKLDQVRPFIAEPLPHAWMRSMHGAADTFGRHHKEQDLAKGVHEVSRFLGASYPYLDIAELKACYAAAEQPMGS